LLLTLLVTPVAYSMFEDWAKGIDVARVRHAGRSFAERLRPILVRRKPAE
jgi:hypothetical protein